MDILLHNMFYLVIQATDISHQPVLTWAAVLEKVARSVIVYLFLIIALRIGGKRELSQLNPFDLVLLLLLSNAVQNAIIGNETSVTGGLIGAATLLVSNYLLVRLLYNHPWLDHLVEGKPDVLVLKGRIQKKALKKELITVEELERAAHKQGIASLGEVERASIDSEGAIAFITKAPTPDEKRHKELLDRLDKLEKIIEGMNGGRAP